MCATGDCIRLSLRSCSEHFRSSQGEPTDQQRGFISHVWTGAVRRRRHWRQHFVCGDYLFAPPTSYSRVVNYGGLFEVNVNAAFAARLAPLLRRVRNFGVTIGLATETRYHGCVGWPAGRQSISREEYDIFQTRDRMKKLVEVIHRYGSLSTKEGSGNTRIRSLKLRSSIGDDYSWCFDEVLAMVIMVAEPFKVLGGAQQPVLHYISFVRDSLARPKSSLDRVNTEYKAYKFGWQAAESQSPSTAYRGPMGPSQTIFDRSQKES
jgi:hypothetical protein